MFIAFAGLLLVLSVPLTGGRLGLLAKLRIRQQPLLLAALVLQVFITDIFAKASRPLLVAVHLGTYVMAGVFIWANRGIPGLAVIAVGAFLNGAVIAINGGTLPASASALKASGIAARPGEFTNTGVLAHPHLSFLGDIITTPGWLPFHNILSIGDLIALAGVAILLHAVCQTIPARALARPQAVVDPTEKVLVSL